MSRRIPELDGLRALAVAALFAGHAFGVRLMWMGVDLFFILSGFLITGILLDEPKQSLRTYLRAFYGRRVRRILPPYLLLLAVVSLLFGVGWVRHWYLYLGLMNYVTAPPLEPLWSLAVEEQFYLLWPLVVFFVGIRRLPWVLVCGLVLVPLLRAACTPFLAHWPQDPYHWVIYRGTPFRCDCLLMGALLTFVWRAHAEKVRRWGALGLLTAVGLPLLLVWLQWRFGSFGTFSGSLRANVWTFELSLLAMAGLLLWALGGRYTAALRVRPARYLARVSYSFYLVHVGLLLFAGRYLTLRWAVTLVAGVASLLYADLSWRWMERPLLRGGNRRIAQGETAAAAPHGAAKAEAALDML